MEAIVSSLERQARAVLDGRLVPQLPRLLCEEGDQLLRSAHGERNYERLEEMRRRYDPAGLFARPE